MLRQMDPVRAYVLHQQEWRDTGRIFEVFTREQGRFSVFAQGVRGPRSKLAGVLQPFVPLRLSWAGKGESPRLTGAEADTDRVPVPLDPARLLPAWYVTELVMKLTLRHDPQPDLFLHYETAMADLRSAALLERSLRLFEKRLLDVLGYGIPGTHDGSANDPLGLARLSPGCLQRLVDENLGDPQDVDQVRPVLRSALALCLEGRDLRTRSVAQALVDIGRVSP